MVSNFTKKSKDEVSRKKIFMQMALLLVSVVLLLLIIADVKIYHDKRDMKAKISEYKKQVEQIKESNQNLKEEIANANNTDYLEQMAYEQFDKHRPGEQEIIFIEAEQTKTEEAKNVNPWLGWVSGVWSWLTQTEE